jgi:hypothetical protein
MNGNHDSKRRLLAVASGGGHWVQLLRLREAFEGCAVTYVTVDRSYSGDVEGCNFHAITDGTMWNKLRLLIMATQLAWILLRIRPHVIISTGAAPGYFAIRLGKLLGARTVWIDSVANVEKLSLSGRKIGPHADLWLTQWPQLVHPDGPYFLGGVL